MEKKNGNNKKYLPPTLISQFAVKKIEKNHLTTVFNLAIRSDNGIL